MVNQLSQSVSHFRVTFLCASKRFFVLNHQPCVLSAYSFSVKSNSFCMKLRFRSKTRFETEACGDSEMAYSINILNIQNL